MTNTLNTNENETATVDEYLAQSAFYDEISNVISGADDYGLTLAVDMNGFIDGFRSQGWLDDKSQLSYLAPHLIHYGQFFKELSEALPDQPITKQAAKTVAEGLTPNIVTFPDTSFMNSV